MSATPNEPPPGRAGSAARDVDADADADAGSPPAPGQPAVEPGRSREPDRGGEASKGILALAWPLMISFTMRSLFSFVDTFYAATLDDPDAAIAAIGLTIPLEFVFIATWVGISNGLTSLYSKALGAREPERMAQLVRTATRMVMAVVPVFVALGGAVYLVAPRLDLDPLVARRFGIYAGTLVAGTGVTSFWSIIPDSIVKAHHDTRSTMVAGILSNLTNVALNTLFTFGFGMGILGLALATVLGRFAGLAYALGRARSLEGALRRRWAAEPHRTERGAYERPLRTLLALAVPSSAGYLLISLESTIVATLLAGLPDAKAAVAAWSIYFRFATFGMTPLIAGAVALLPYVARAWGERDLARVREGVRTLGLVTIASVALVVGPVYVGLAPSILRALSDDPATIRYGVFALRLAPVACLATLPFLLVRPIFEGMQRSLPGMMVSLLRYAVLTYPLAWLGMALAPRFGHDPFHGVLCGVVASAAAASALFALLGVRQLARAERALEGDPAAAHLLASSGSLALPGRTRG